MKPMYIIISVVALALIFLAVYVRLVDSESSFSLDTYKPIAENTVTIDPPTNNTNMDTSEQNTTTQVVMKTNKGDITLELFTGAMPVTTENFLKLAREDFYDGIKFHRVINGFMIQGGDPLTKDDAAQARWGTGGPGYSIKDEFGTGLSNVRGTIAMANSGPNTGGSQFFINTVDNTYLDSKHPVFGRVVSGMDVVDTITQVKTAPGDVPLEPVVIEDIVVSQ